MKNIIILLFLMPTISFSQTEKNIFEEADSLLKSYKFEESIPLYSKLITIDSVNQKYYRGRGFAFMQIKKYEKAKSDYLKASELNNKCLNCLINLSQIYLGLDDNKTALEYANSAVLIDSAGSGLTQRGKVYYFSNNNMDAVFDLNEAKKENPKNIENYYFAAYCYMELKFEKRAIENALKTVELEPDLENMLYLVSRTYNSFRKYDKALPYLDKCIEKDSNNYMYYRDKAASYAGLRNIEESIIFYKKSIEKGNTNYYDYSFIAQNYYSLEDMDSSCKYSELALSNCDKNNLNFISGIKNKINDHCDSTKPNYYYQRGIAMYNLKRFKESIKYHEKGIEKFPNNAWLWNFRGNSLLADKQYEKAIKSYKKSLPLYSKKFTIDNYKLEVNKDTKKQFVLVIYLSIFDAFSDLNKYDSASFYLDKSESILNKIENPSIKIEYTSEILFRKGNVLMLKNQINKAIVKYSESIKVNPEHFMSRYNRAYCLMTKNNSKSNKYQTRSFFLNYKGTSQSVYKKTSRVIDKVNKAELREAFLDLNIILNKDKTNGKVYLLRGIIKKRLDIFDYCMDIQKAIELGILNADIIAETNCN